MTARLRSLLRYALSCFLAFSRRLFVYGVNSSSRKRLNLGVKSLISLILIIGILFSFSVSSSAASSVTYRLADFEIDTNTPPTYFGTYNFNNKVYTQITFDYDKDVRVVALRKISNELKAGNSYTLAFDIIRGPGTGTVTCQLLLSSDPSNIDEAVDLGFFDTADLKNNSSQDYSIQLTYPDKFNGKQCYLMALLVTDKNFSITYVSDLVFTNNNQTEEKIDGILEWLSAVYHSIVGGEDSRGVQHDGLVQGIKNGLTNLGNTIGGFFENLKTSIEVKIDGIKQWFVELGENIIDGIKSLFIPSEDFLNDKLDEFLDVYEDHFGIFAQSTTYFINAIRKVETTLNDNYTFEFPELSFTLQGHKYVFSEHQTVNIQQWLESGSWSANLYEMYRVFASSFLIYLVLLYARKVEAVILNNTPELAEEFTF